MVGTLTSLLLLRWVQKFLEIQIIRLFRYSSVKELFRVTMATVSSIVSHSC